jgi:hypothetical protein
MPAAPLNLSLAARSLFVVAVLAAAVAVRAEPTSGSAAQVGPAAPRAAPAKAPAERQAAALRACSQRADLLFVRKCVQACMIDSKSKTRVLQESFDRDTCQQRCGHQRELPSFVDACLRRAGFGGAPLAAR